MTQSAVSQHVTGGWSRPSGSRLFRRLHRGVALTEAGVVLYAAVGRGLDTIEAALNELRREPRAPALSIATDFGFASFWLMPRLRGAGGGRFPASRSVSSRPRTRRTSRRSTRMSSSSSVCPSRAPCGFWRKPWCRCAVRPFSSATARRTARSTGAACRCLDLEGPEPSRWLRRATGSRRKAFRRAAGARRRCFSIPIRWWWRRRCSGRVRRSAGSRCCTRHLASGALVTMAEAPLVTDRGYALLEPASSAGNPAVPLFRRWLLAACEV